MSGTNKLPCCMCGTPTLGVVNINLTARFLCESCANQITLQQVTYLIKTKIAENASEQMEADLQEARNR